MNQEKIKNFFDSAGFSRHNGIVTEEIREGYARMSLNLTADGLNLNGVVHGGLLFSLADLSAGAGAVTYGENVTTIDGSINFIRPCTGGKITAEAEVIHKGRKTAVFSVNITNDAGKLLSHATITMFFTGKLPDELLG